MAHVNLGERLFMNFDRADFMFVVENEKIPGHKMLLAETLPYFEKLLYGGLMESTSKEITISGTSAMVFKEVMRYIYMGQLKITGWHIDDLLSILCLAHEYQFDKLVSEVVKCLQSKRVDFDSWESIQLAASTYDLDALKSMSTSFAEEKIEEFVRFQGLEHFTAEFVCFMFESPKISTVNQEELLNAISKWKTIRGTAEIMTVFQNICWDKVSSHLINIIVKDLFSKLQDADDCQFWSHVGKCIENSLECVARFDKIMLRKHHEIRFESPNYQSLLRGFLDRDYIELWFSNDRTESEIPIRRIEWEFLKHYRVSRVFGWSRNLGAIDMVVSEPTARSKCFKYSAKFSDATPLSLVGIFSEGLNAIREITLQNIVIS